MVFSGPKWHHSVRCSEFPCRSVSCPAVFGIGSVRGPEGLQALSLIEPEAWNHLDSRKLCWVQECFKS